MSEQTDRREAEALIQGYLDDSLTESEGRLLLASLSRDPSQVQAILEGLRMDCLIRTVLAEAHSTVNAEGKLQQMPRTTPGPVLSADLRQRSWGWPRAFALAACLTLLAGFSVWFFCPTMGDPVLSGLQGSDVSIERGTEFIPGVNGTRFELSDVLRIGTNASAMITFGKEQTQLTVLSGSELKVVNWKS